MWQYVENAYDTKKEMTEENCIFLCPRVKKEPT